MSRSASEVVSQEFLQIRAKILEIAAFYDRLEDGNVSDAQATQLDLLQRGCGILTDTRHDKAARVQLLFSREYDEQWRERFGI